jgi:hypothetical protein
MDATEPSATELAEMLAQRAHEVCELLLPAGRLDQGNWIIGSTKNDEGKSLHVQLTGNRAGLWLDFATGEKGDLIGLWRAARGASLRDTCTEAMKFLGIERVQEEREEPTASQAWTQLQREMGTGTSPDIDALVVLRKLPNDDGLRAAIENGHLFFGPVFDKADSNYHHSWIITDSSRMGAQARRLDGKPYGDGQKSKTIHGTAGRWPIGIADAGNSLDLAMVEGGPDFLAAYTAIEMLGLANQIQPVAMLGSSQTIHPNALEKFCGRTVWIFPHNDDNMAGIQGAIRWQNQLKSQKITLIPFDFRPYPGVKDLNDFVSLIGGTK